MPPIPQREPKPEPDAKLASMFGIVTAAETQQALRDADFAKGYETASVMALTIDRQIREAFPGQSRAFYEGVMAGIRQEI